MALFRLAYEVLTTQDFSLEDVLATSISHTATLTGLSASSMVFPISALR